MRRLAFMLDRLGDACFAVIAYLVGARASEILRLEEGCLERRPADGDGEEHVYLVGTITKTSRTEHGDIHRWLAPEPVQRAIVILERLSAPLRELSGEKNYGSTSSVGDDRHFRRRWPSRDCDHRW
ncbi:hypothetical protein [Sphingomonas oryzagri]